MAVNMDLAREKLERDVLFGKIQTLYDKAQERVNKRIERERKRNSKLGLATSDDATEDEQAVLDAYSELMGMVSSRKYPLEDVEWLFNNGALRSGKEIEEFNQRKKEENYRNSDEFQLALLYEDTKAEHKRCVLQRLCWLIPEAVAILAFLCLAFDAFLPRFDIPVTTTNPEFIALKEERLNYLYEHDFAPEAYESEYYKTLTEKIPHGAIGVDEDRVAANTFQRMAAVNSENFKKCMENVYYEMLDFSELGPATTHWIIIGFLFLGTFIGTFAILGGAVIAVDYNAHKRTADMYYEAGLKPPVPIGLLADTGVYAMFLHAFASLAGKAMK